MDQATSPQPRKGYHLGSHACKPCYRSKGSNPDTWTSQGFKGPQAGQPPQNQVVGSMAHRRGGVEYGPSFEFLMHKENLSLSTSVAPLKRFFSTTKHTNKSFLSKYHTKRYETP
jgi:hypothetical protein